MRRVNASDRLFTFPQFQRTAESLKDVMTRAGLEQVEVLGAPADGVTQYGFHTMPLAWDARSARLEIVAPTVAADARVLADYPRIPTSLGMWSGPTPPGGLTTEVVELPTADLAAAEKIDMKGKLVLTRPSLLGLTDGLKWLLVKKGAAGAINAFTENPDLKDDRQWVNFWGDSGWAYTKRSTPLVWFSVTPRQADLLHDLLARGKVTVKAMVDARYYSGPYAYTTGVLPGTGAEEVLELGHDAEYGANDNATGVAALLEAVAALNRLIGAGKLPRPRRTIRILTMPELYPTMHYLATYPERTRRTVAAICLDTAAGLYERAGTEFGARLTPDVARSYIDALLIHVADAYFPHLTPQRHFHPGPYGTGTDNFLGDPTIGVPTVAVTGGTGIRMHHNSFDTAKQVDPRSLRDLAVVTAGFLYAVASAGEGEAPWLAEMAAGRGYQQSERVAEAMLDRMAVAASAADLAALLREGLDRIAYEADRESAAVRSVLRIVPEDRREAVGMQLEPAVEGLRRFAAEQTARLRRAADRRAAALGAPVPVEPAAAAQDQQMAAAQGMVVTRKRFGTLPLDDLPVTQWEGYPYASWDLVSVTALYWCDGRRDLAEVVRLTRLEYDTGNFDFVGYFRFLAKHGYVGLTSR